MDKNQWKKNDHLDRNSMPVGFGMQLAQDPEAMSAFTSLPIQEQKAMIRRIQSVSTGKEAENAIRQEINCLLHHS